MAKTTLQVLSDRSGDRSTLVAAGEVMDLRYDNPGQALSLRAAKLFHLLIDVAGGAACEDRTHSVRLADLDYLRHLSIEDTVEVARELVRTTVRLDRVREGKRATAVGPLMSMIDRDHDAQDGSLRFRLSPVLIEVIQNSHHWAALRRQAVLAFESRYSLRLYEILALRAKLDHKTVETFTIDELRERLGVAPGTLSKWSHFHDRALAPAIAEVNQLSGFNVTMEPVKHRRSVAAVKLTWRVGSNDERAQVARELAASKVGRKARREGAVEQVEPAPVAVGEAGFPADGPIRYSRWADIIRDNWSGVVPDVDQFADVFRAWCRGRNIPLNAKSIEKTFTTFVTVRSDEARN